MRQIVIGDNQFRLHRIRQPDIRRELVEQQVDAHDRLKQRRDRLQKRFNSVGVNAQKHIVIMLNVPNVWVQQGQFFGVLQNRCD